MSKSVNDAIIETLRTGVVRNVSVMAVGASLEDAAEQLLAFGQVCIGLHVTLTSEWEQPRYRPILPQEQVASLIDGEGSLLPTPTALHERPFDLDEAMAEVTEQLAALRHVGLEPRYLDEHMGVGWLPGLRDRLKSFCREHGLVYAPALTRPMPSVEADCSRTLADGWIAAIERLDVGSYLLITHPMSGVESDQDVANHRFAPGEVARRRNADRLALLDPRLGQAVRSSGVRLVDYVELAEEGRSVSKPIPVVPASDTSCPRASRHVAG